MKLGDRVYKNPMSFFDYFEPVPKRRCQICFNTLSDWQGEGLGGFFLWRQGAAKPVDQKVDDEVKCSPDYRDRQRLPECFIFHTDCKTCNIPITAEGLSIQGAWRYTLIKDPEMVYPSGEAHGLFAINILIQTLAERLGQDLIVYEEDGLGTYRAFEQKLSFGPTIFLKQSDHLTNVKLYGNQAQSGPSIYVDAYDAIKYGYDKLYWGAIHALNISEENVVIRVPAIDSWVNEARDLIWKGSLDV